MLKKIVLIVILVSMALSSGIADKDIFNFENYSYDELNEIHADLDSYLYATYSEYDYILLDGDYFMDVDIPSGDIMAYRLNLDSEYSIITAYEDKQIIDRIFVSSEHPRSKINLPENGMIMVENGPIGLKYLND